MKKLLLSLLVSVTPLLAINGIQLDSISSGAIQLGSGSTGVSWAHTIGSGNNRFLAVAIAGLLNVTSSSCTFNAVSMTKAANVSSTISEIWYLAAPATGTHNIVCAWTALNQGYESANTSAVSFFGVNQTTPVTATAAGSAISQAITTTGVNQWLFGAAVNHNGTLSSASSQVETYNRIGTSDAGSVSIGYFGYAINGSNTMTWTASGGTGPLGTSVIAIQPVLTQITSLGGGGMLLLPTPIASPGFSTASSQFEGNPSGGDTHYFAWTSASTRSGNFGGGAIVANWNDDASGGFGCGNSSVCAYELLTYDPVTQANTTFGVLNSMVSYGTNASATGCYDQTATSVSMKTRAMFALPGYIFQVIGCMKNTNFFWYQTGIIVSPDSGVHWCNYKTFNAHAVSPGCDSSNWAANDGTHNGDNPVDASGFQWPITQVDTTSEVARMMLVDFLCADNTVNCPAAPGVDPSYLYFTASKATTASTSGMYLYRVPKSPPLGVMNPANWQALTATTPTWATNTNTNAIDISGGASVLGGAQATGRMVYLRDSAMFVIFAHGSNASQHLFYQSPLPWGTWSVLLGGPTLPDTSNQFPSLVAGLGPTYTTAGQVTYVMGSNGVGAANLTLRKVNFGTPLPIYAH